MKHWKLLLTLALVAGTLLSACQTATPTSTPEPTEEATPPPTATSEATPAPDPGEVIYLDIIWHQHQPVYYKDPETGIYAKPWVRLHAAKDYVDMAAMLQDYPNVHVTFNLTPSLIRQIDDYVQNGAQDAYWVHTEVPADQLSDDQKRFILRYFFDINGRIIDRFPRYQELRDMRPGPGEEAVQAALDTWTAQDFLDLQVLFNLGWTDPDWLAQEPLASLVARERDYSEEDKAVVLAEHLRLLQETIPVHAALQDAGQIEVTMTPYAHPILPLLLDTNLATVAMPAVTLPTNRFRYGQDAVAHLERGVELYRYHFDTDPRGMWPAEGSVAQGIVNMVGRAGIQWMASDEGVLAQSLGMGTATFPRDPVDTVQDADALYRPYFVQGADQIPVMMVFRDRVLSDKVGFSYSSVSGTAAAQDFVNRVHAAREQLQAQGAEGPHLFTVILDGENAWENYENDGKEFLHALYQLLSEDPLIRTVTPSEYLALFPEQRAIDELWAGSWIGADFSTWIGEDEENTAWDYLAETRALLQKYQNGVRQASPEAVALAEEWMYISEGSDWFWWYGADQDSGSDADFDRQFRDSLRQVYLALGEEPPLFLDVPIISQRAQAADQAAGGLLTEVTVDGAAAEGEWDAAGYYDLPDTGSGEVGDQLERLYYGFDAQNLYLRLDTRAQWGALTTAGNPFARTTVGVYLNVPGGGAVNPFSRWGGRETLLGFGANRLVEVTFAPLGVIESATVSTADGAGGWADPQPLTDASVGGLLPGNTLELAIPFEQINPNLTSGDRINLRLVYSAGLEDAASDLALVPATGPAALAVPDLGLMTTVLEVSDPEGDDHGWGEVTYPTNAVFGSGAFDLLGFTVGYDDANIIFRFSVRGPVENGWNAPNGFSIQAFDVYIDQDGPASGARLLLPARNAALSADYAWDYAVRVNGWTPAVLQPDADGNPVEISTEVTLVPDAGQRRVTVKVPKSVLGDDPEAWHYLAFVMSHDGYGPNNVRELAATAQEWQPGGRPDGTNYPRIFDVVWPADAAPTQEEMLGGYTLSQAEVETLGPDDFAQLGMLPQ